MLPSTFKHSEAVASQVPLSLTLLNWKLFVFSVAGICMKLLIFIKRYSVDPLITALVFGVYLRACCTNFLVKTCTGPYRERRTQT